MFRSDKTHLLLSEPFWAQPPRLRFSEAALEFIHRLAKRFNEPIDATREGLTHLLVADLRARSGLMVAEGITGVDFTVCRESGAPATVLSVDLAYLAISDLTGEATLCFDVDLADATI